MTNSDWWAKRLTNQPTTPVGRPNPVLPMPPSQQPMAPMPTFQPQATTKATSANSYATCPDCGSGNYMAATPQVAPRCYDCGYPIQQSGSRFGGLAGAHVEGTAKPATGNDATSNWNPQGIIGRID